MMPCHWTHHFFLLINHRKRGCQVNCMLKKYLCKPLVTNEYKDVLNDIISLWVNRYLRTNTMCDLCARYIVWDLTPFFLNFRINKMMPRVGKDNHFYQKVQTCLLKARIYVCLVNLEIHRGRVMSNAIFFKRFSLLTG